MADVKALVQQARVLREDGRLAQALLAARSAVAADDEDANAWWQLALVQSDLNDEEGEREALEALLELAPDFVAGRFAYGLLLYLEQNLEDAAEQFELALEENPDHVDSLRYLAKALEQQKDQSVDPRCLQVLQRLHELGEAEDNEIFRLAYLYGRQNDAAASAHLYERLATLLKRTGSLQNLSLMYRRLQRDADSMDAARLSHSLDTSSAVLTKLVEGMSERRRVVREAVRKLADPYLAQTEWYRHYVNPFSLLDLEPEEASANVKALQKARQAVLRELELEDNSVDWMPGLHIDRSSALALFEELNDASRFEAHANVYRNPALNAFLSTGSLKHFTYDPPDIADVQLQAKVARELVEPISMKFAAQFDDVLTKAIESADSAAVQALMAGRRWVLPEHTEKCFEGPIRALTRMGEGLDALRDKAKATPVPAQEVKTWLERSQLVKLLPALPLEFHRVHERYYSRVSQLSASHYNSGGDAEQALELLNLAKECAQKSVVLQHEYETARSTLQGFIDEEAKEAATVTFHSGALTINKKGIAHGSKFIPAAQVHTFRWGMAQTSAQPPEWRLAIFFGNGAGLELGVSWVSGGAALESQRVQWGRLIDAAVKFILVHALDNFKKKLSTGVELSMGNVRVTEKGVTFSLKGFIFSRDHFVPWDYVVTSMANGDVVLRDRRQAKAIARVSLIHVDNALLLRMLTPHQEN